MSHVSCQHAATVLLLRYLANSVTARSGLVMNPSAWPLRMPTRLPSREDTGALLGSEIMKRIFLAVLALSIFLAATTISSPATLLAAHKGQGQNTNSSLSLVLLNSTDGLAHWGQNMTFNVSTTATSYPSVGLNCHQ